MENEHLPWIGANYEQGIDGTRILIAGWSHHGIPDHQAFTNEVVGRWAEGDENAPFAPRIRTYFGDDDAPTFWNKVAFVNTLPTSVGDSDDNRYSKGTPEQRARATPRSLEIVRSLKPDKVIVFSAEAWRLWPSFTPGYVDQFLTIDDVAEVPFGPYAHTGGSTWAYGLHHPQFSPTAIMTRSVQEILKHRPTV